MVGKSNNENADSLAGPRSPSAPIIERSPLPIVEVRGDTHVVCYVNSAFCTLLAKTRGELIGKPFAEIVCGGEECVAILDRVYQTGKAATYAQEDACEADPGFWLYAIWPALDEKERPSRVIVQLTKAARSGLNAAQVNEALMISALRQHELTGAAENLNEQLQNEIAERKRAQKASFLLASIVEGSGDSIISIDFNQTITSWNKGAERLYGCSAEEVIGKPISMLTLPEDLKAAWSRLDRVRSGEKVETFETESRQKHGGPVWMSVSLSPIRDETGQLIGVSTVSREITEQKCLEQELRAAREELQRRANVLEEAVDERTAELGRSIKSLEDLNYTMAHDLRAPIRAMKAFSTALLEDVPLDRTGKEYAERIDRAADRMDELVNDLLEYGELTHREFSIGPVALKAQIEKALAQLADEIQRARAEIQVQEPLPTILGNERLISQVLTNLLSNALKFVTPGVLPKVFVHAEIRDSMARLWIDDNGIGVPGIYKEKIFGVFQRLHTTEEFPGTGVGLAIVRRAAERMGGTVGVESAPREGSKFWIELPRPI
jgi:PAS domain S-box-containing protein